MVAAVLAMLTYSTALQRGTVTQATAPLVVGETVAPALVGLLLLGDEPRQGWGWAATLGFALAVGGRGQPRPARRGAEVRAGRRTEREP